MNAEHVAAATTPEQRVDVALARAGLPVTPEEREHLVRIAPTIDGMMRRLRLPEARYAEPATIHPIYPIYPIYPTDPTHPALTER